MTQRGEIDRVFREGRVIRLGPISARLSSSELSHPRVGFIVPRHGHSAVERNRLKRRLRELVRAELLSAPVGVDVVLIASGRAYESDFAGLRERVLSLRTLVGSGAERAEDGGGGT